MPMFQPASASFSSKYSAARSKRSSTHNMSGHRQSTPDGRLVASAASKKAASGNLDLWNLCLLAYDLGAVQRETCGFTSSFRLAGIISMP
jgi:hypothetical protein